MFQQTTRSEARRFWEAAMVYCHHNWSQERCAAEIGFEEVILTLFSGLVVSPEIMKFMFMGLNHEKTDQIHNKWML